MVISERTDGRGTGEAAGVLETFYSLTQVVMTWIIHMQNFTNVKMYQAEDLCTTSFAL